jgi:hypothetical protein
MMRKQVFSAALAATVAAACTDISDNATTALSIQLDPLPSPSVVVGDSLRDTTGAIVVPTVHLFNYQGEEIAPDGVRFYSADAGVSVDSISGVIRGDSLRSTPARIVAAVGSLQALQNIDVTLRPDNVVAVAGRDTLQYSHIDSTLNVSSQLTIKVMHGTPPADTAVRSYIVSFAVVSGGDPRLAELVNGGRASLVDTTDASGVAGRAVRVRPVYLPAAVDSVIVNATVKYRGMPVSGSPVRLVVELKPPA